jgi:predicted nicotinamide N-methyase
MKGGTFTFRGEPVTTPPRHARSGGPGRIATVSETSAAFVRLHARLAPVAFVPEIRLHQADDAIGLWELTEGEFRSEQPPPFWAFAWAGGQALARYLLDHPEVVAGRRVLDLASGSGLVAIAAARAGAVAVRAVEIDDRAVTAINLNADANRVPVEAVLADILDGDTGDTQVVLAGDVFYSQAMANRVLRFLLRGARTGARVLVGDPDRAFLPRDRFRPLTTYDVPVPPVLESVTVKRTTVWELNPPAGAAADRDRSTE